MQKCPHCSTKLFVPGKKSGSSIACPRCGNSFVALVEHKSKLSPGQISVRCRNCFKGLRIRPEQIGQRRTCPKCRAKTLLKPSESEPRSACPRCYKTFRIPSDMLGHQHACPNCLASVRLNEVSGKQTVICDDCQEPLHVPAKLLGQTGRCSHCGSKTLFVAVAQVPMAKPVDDDHIPMAEPVLDDIPMAQPAPANPDLLPPVFRNPKRRND